jgi:hypothetical protein
MNNIILFCVYYLTAIGIVIDLLLASILNFHGALWESIENLEFDIYMYSHRVRFISSLITCRDEEDVKERNVRRGDGGIRNQNQRVCPTVRHTDDNKEYNNI